ncbi:E3 ubiquitin-protein ligase [Dirofilaria immitis]
MYNTSETVRFIDEKKRSTTSNSDYAISSGQFQSRYVVRKISDMISGLNEFGETSKSNENFKDLTRKYYNSDRRFSDECNYALYIRTVDRKVYDKEIRYSRCSYLSDIGALCEACTEYPFIISTCLRAVDQRKVFDSSTVHSFAVTDCSTFLSNETIIEKFCRICHSFGNSADPLISPCRCTGSLKYVHISCLLHWLTICTHKLKRPTICELCLYNYRLRNIVNWHNLRLPSISRRDLRYLISFIIASVIMFLSAITSFICFCIERNLERNDTIEDNSETIVKENNEWETLILKLFTFLSALFFFISLLVAIFAHIKAYTSLLRYFYRLWINNQNWVIEEYRPSCDQRYCHKMEQLRRRLNDEITPNYETEEETSNEVVCSRGGVREKLIENSRAVFLRSSSLLSSSIEASISGFNSMIAQEEGTVIDTANKTIPNYIIPTTVTTPAVV